MKYRVILVDDEPKILQLVELLGHFEEYGIEIAARCHDGKETLEKIKELRPDFVLSDIKMPDMDGIELIEETRKAGIDSLFVLLSGYRHFEYAKSAIALNVVDYLLKPVDEEQLTKTLEKVCRQIDQLREARENEAELSHFRKQLTQGKTEQFWYDFWREGSHPVVADEAAFNERYGTAFQPGCYQILNIVTNMSGIMEHSDAVFGNEAERLLMRCFEGKAVYYGKPIYAGYSLILNFPRERAKEIKESVVALYYGLRQLKEIYGSFRLNIGVSRVVSSCADIPAAQMQAEAAEWGRLVMMNDGVLDYDQIASLARIGRSDLVTDPEIAQIADCVRYLRREEMGGIFSELYRRASAHANCYPGTMADCFFDILFAVRAAVKAEDAMRTEDVLFYAYSDARSFPLLMKKMFLALDTLLAEELKKASEKTRKPIAEAAAYVREHFAEPLSAEEVAEHSHVSATYLSRLFSQEMEMGFLEFLTQVRLEEAQKLLAETNLPIKEVASRSGYPDEKYFSKLFKKVTGLKPTEYRRIYG